MSGGWAVFAAIAVAALAVVVIRGLALLWLDMCRAERDLAIERRLLDRYGGSVTWNNEDRAQVGARPVSAPTPHGRNGR